MVSMRTGLVLQRYARIHDLEIKLRPTSWIGMIFQGKIEDNILSEQLRLRYTWAGEGELEGEPRRSAWNSEAGVL